MRAQSCRTLAAVSVAALIAVSCGAPSEMPVDEPVETPTPEPAEEPVETPEGRSDGESSPDPDEANDGPALTNECHNDVDGYRIQFPEGWHTNDGSVTAPCQVFAVEPPEIEPATEFPFDVALLLSVIDQPFGEVEEMTSADPSIDIEHLEPTMIGGRDALRIDGTSTGEGLLDAGVGLHITHLAFDGRTVAVSAYEYGQPGLAERRDIIARMLETLSDDRQE